MIAFFGVTSLFGTLLFLLLILIAAVQKKPVKVPAIGAGICFVVLLVAPNDANMNTPKLPTLHFFDLVAAVVSKFQK